MSTVIRVQSVSGALKPTITLILPINYEDNYQAAVKTSKKFWVTSPYLLAIMYSSAILYQNVFCLRIMLV